MVSEGGGEGSPIVTVNKSEEVQKGEREGDEEEEEEVRSPPLAFATPTDLLITRIFAQLDCIDLLHCSLVCKQWYTDSAELREGWKNEYLESRKIFGLGLKRETHPPSTKCSIRGLHSWCP